MECYEDAQEILKKLDTCSRAKRATSWGREVFEYRQPRAILYTMLPPTHGQRSQQQSGQITLQPVLKFLKATHGAKIRKIEIPTSMVVEALSW